MSMARALGNLSISNWRDRRQTRNGHERLENDPDDLENQSEAGVEVSENPSQNSVLVSSVTRAESAPQVETVSDNGDDAVEDVEGGERNGDAVIEHNGDRVSLRELEEEREAARRRTSACLLLVIFVLFRLWIEALTQADFGLLMISLIGTSWCARWIRHNREREEELDRRIAAYLENAEEGTTEVNRSDLRMLSFQAQLALAIMESQRQMMQGGFGHPDGPQNADVGVSDEARSQWERFEYKDPNPTAKGKGKGDYGTVAQEDKLDSGEEEPSCTICLCEYEDGDGLVRLPCNHIFHEECISSWTTNHVRCPLCNYDLESVTTENTSSVAASESS